MTKGVTTLQNGFLTIHDKKGRFLSKTLKTSDIMKFILVII